MDKEAKYIATVMEKHFIKDNVYVYSPLYGVVGTKEGEKFIDEEGREYLTVINKDLLDSNINIGIGNIIEFNQYIERQNGIKNITVDKLVSNYNEEVKDIIYLICKKDDKISFWPVLINETESFEDKVDYIDENDEYDEFEDDIVELISAISSGYYSLEELEDIKEQFLLRQDDIISVLDTINEEIKEEQEDIDDYNNRGIINIEEVYNKVTKTLIAQDDAALELITEIASLDMEDNKKSGILLTGSTGVGKTKLMELVSKYLNRPFLFIDSNQLTAPAYTGKNIEEYLFKLFEDCHYNKQQAERAIVYFDEIDKKGSRDKSNPAGQAVLSLLLKFLDGTTYTACENSQVKNPGTYVDINTSNMIIVAGGAFSDVYNSIYDKKINGFNSSNDSNEYVPNIDDFVIKGQMTYEFMGRFPVIIHLKDLNIPDFKSLLEKSDESPIIYAKNKFKKMDGVELKFTDGYLQKASQLAYNKKYGARGLEGIIRKSISKPFRKINANLGFYSEVILDEKVFEDSDSYQLVKKYNINKKD